MSPSAEPTPVRGAGASTRAGRRGGASPAARVLAGAVRLYRGVREVRPGLPTCRYVPSCSAYGLEALETHGAVRGSWLTVRRVCRCNPWGGYGYDPVPEASRRAASHPAAPMA